MIENLSRFGQSDVFLVPSNKDKRITITRYTEDSAKDKKRDTVVELRGSSLKSLTSPDGNKVYRITYQDNVDGNIYLAFYFYDNDLIYSQLRYTGNFSDTTVFTETEYYRSGKSIYRSETVPLSSSSGIGRVNLNLSEEAKRYQAEVLADRKKDQIK